MIDPSMMGGPPAGAPAPSITLGGGAPPAPPAESGGSEWPSDPVALARKLLEGTRKLAEIEPDDEDQAAIEKLGADISKYIAAQQKLTDSAMGAGPGVKLVRKAAGNSGAGY